MTASAGFTIGLRWRGFGYYGDALLPEMRMGFVAIWWRRMVERFDGVAR